MRIATFKKQPSERKRFVVDMSSWMTSASEYVSAVDDDVAVRATSPTPPGASPLTFESLDIPATSQQFSFFVAAGEDGITYTLTLIITTTLSQIKEIEIEYKVKDD
jgi:hypothetical protein